MTMRGTAGMDWITSNAAVVAGLCQRRSIGTILAVSQAWSSCTEVRSMSSAGCSVVNFLALAGGLLGELGEVLPEDRCRGAIWATT
ncbi:MAG: hypothetical protein ACI8Y4_005481 [Candidatus Poriferisodalaceae bacterium]|jgi:hypothetical protein